MIIGLDISTSITGITVLDNEGNIILNEAWDLRKYKDFFQKADYVNKQIKSFHKKIDPIVESPLSQHKDPLDGYGIKSSITETAFRRLTDEAGQP